jgi:acyl-CoA synthetase (AMP-forming)/AMP-acid ligase II
MKMKPKTFIIAIVACVILAGITIHSFMPSSIISAIGLKTSDISSCSIIVNRTSDPSVDFRGTQLIPLLDALKTRQSSALLPIW